jgi:hypothetical protein
MNEAWQARRAELNHLQMRNLFLNSVTASLSRLESQQSDGDLMVATAQRLSRWPRLAAEYRSLIEDFPQEMSPAVMVDRPPLNQLPATWRDSAREMLLVLWRARHPVDEWMHCAMIALEEADSAYREMVPATGAAKFTASALEVFHQRCLALCEAVSRFPSRIPLV